MSFYWLCYRHNNQVSVVIEPGASSTLCKVRSLEKRGYGWGIWNPAPQAPILSLDC
jgi:hypothetical protein